MHYSSLFLLSVEGDHHFVSLGGVMQRLASDCFMESLKVFWDRGCSVRLAVSSPFAYKARWNVTLKAGDTCGVWGLIHSLLRSVPF